MSKIFKAITNIFSPAKMVANAMKMPDPGSTTAKLAAQKKLDERRKGGRDSTIYSNSGGAYTGSNLAGTA